MTAITRQGSKGEFPAGVKIARVDYENEDSLVAALRGQQFFIITLSVYAPADTHSKLVKAAAKAGVPYIMPNAYGSDVANESLFDERIYVSNSIEGCNEIQSLGASYIAMVCGFWYEWSLALGDNFFGINIKDRRATFFDAGTEPINVSTWEQCGRAIAGLLSLPESGADPALSQWKNKPFYCASFRVSQRDMLDSVHRVIGTSDKDWTITHAPSAQRYEEAIEELQAGQPMGRVKAMYTRVFFPNGGGDFESTRGLSNDVIGLPKEKLDEASARAVKMVESGWNPFG